MQREASIFSDISRTTMSAVEFVFISHAGKTDKDEKTQEQEIQHAVHIQLDRFGTQLRIEILS